MTAFRKSLLVACFAVVPASALMAESAPAVPPTTVPSVAIAPSDADIAALIDNLGDGDFATRDQASNKLREIGKPALAQIKAALKSEDPEVRIRAEELVKRIERRVPPGPDPAIAGVGGQGLRVSVVNGNKVIDVTDIGRVIHISNGPDGIDMTVTGVRNGEKATEEYKAANPEDLKRDNPEAYAIFEKWSGGQGPAWVMNGGGGGRLIIRGGVGGGGIVVNNGNLNLNGIIQRANAADEVADLRKKITEQMKEAKLPDEKQVEVANQLDKLDTLKRGDPDATVDEEQQRITNFMDQSDLLRKKLEELKLPDPGDALPPPAKARLGVSLVNPDDPLQGGGEGLRVAKVLPDSRAEKIGLKEDDTIKKVNGQAVHSVKELRQAAMNTKKPLAIEIDRAGEAVKLEEKP